MPFSCLLACLVLSLEKKNFLGSKRVFCREKFARAYDIVLFSGLSNWADLKIRKKRETDFLKEVIHQIKSSILQY